MRRPRGSVARRRPAVENCGLQLRNRRGGSAQPPQGGFADEARNVQLPGVLCGFHPRTMAAAEGRWAPTRPAVGNCGLRMRNRGAVPASPVRGFASEARNVQLPGVLRGFHPRAAARTWA